MSQPAESTGNPPITAEEEKLWGMLAHLLTLPMALTALGHLVAPGVVYLVYKDRSKYVAFHAWQSLWWQMGVTAALIIFGLLSFCFIGIPLAIVTFIAGPVMTIIAAVKAYQGEWYRYPLIGDMAQRQLER